MLKQLYYTLIYPYLNHGLATCSWGAAYKTRLNKIYTKQKKCIQSMFFAHGKEHVNPFYNLWRSAPKAGVEFSTYVGDDDSTTLADIHAKVP